MSRVRLTKTDEALLKGEHREAWRLMLKTVRRARTGARNSLAQLDLADRKWPDKGAAERASMREQMELAVERGDRLEARLLDALSREEKSP